MHNTVYRQQSYKGNWQQQIVAVSVTKLSYKILQFESTLNAGKCKKVKKISTFPINLTDMRKHIFPHCLHFPQNQMLWKWKLRIWQDQFLKLEPSLGPIIISKTSILTMILLTQMISGFISCQQNSFIPQTGTGEQVPWKTSKRKVQCNQNMGKIMIKTVLKG